MRYRYTAIVIVVTVGCSASAPTASTEYDKRIAYNESLYGESELSVEEFQRLAQKFDRDAAVAYGRFREASQQWKLARAHYMKTSVAYERAREDYRRAAARYRMVTTVILMSAAADYVRYACGSQMSVRSYRAKLRREGLDLRGIDIDHIIPRSRGGLDRTWNYAPLEARINRSLQAGGQLWKLQNLPLETINAWVAHAVQLLACRGG